MYRCISTRAGSVLAACVLWGVGPLAAQTAALEAKTRADVIDSVAARLERHYIDLDTARLIGAALKAASARVHTTRCPHPHVLPKWSRVTCAA